MLSLGKRIWSRPSAARNEDALAGLEAGMRGDPSVIGSDKQFNGDVKAAGNAVEGIAFANGVLRRAKSGAASDPCE